jgi:hypothetical protein
VALQAIGHQKKLQPTTKTCHTQESGSQEQACQETLLCLVWLGNQQCQHESCSQEQACQEALRHIVQLGDKQHQAWIPETTDRLLQWFAEDPKKI